MRNRRGSSSLSKRSICELNAASEKTFLLGCFTSVTSVFFKVHCGFQRFSIELKYLLSCRLKVTVQEDETKNEGLGIANGNHMSNEIFFFLVFELLGCREQGEICQCFIYGIFRQHLSTYVVP